MPITPAERREYIAELTRLDPNTWASLIEYHRTEIRRQEKDQT